MAIKQLFAAFFICALFANLGNGQTTARWINPDGGDWSNGANWDIGLSPENSDTESYEVLIDLETTDDYIVYGTAASVSSLTIDSENVNFFVQGNSPDSPQDKLSVDGVINLLSGKLTTAYLSRINADEIRLNGNELDLGLHTAFERALVVGDFDVDDSRISFEQGASFNGLTTVRSESYLEFKGDPTIRTSNRIDDSEVNIRSSSYFLATDNLDFTLGETARIVGDGTVGVNSTSTFINEGKIEADAGSTLQVSTGSWHADDVDVAADSDYGQFINRGEMRARSGSSIIHQHSANWPSNWDIGYGKFVNDVDGTIIVEDNAELILDHDWTSRGSIDVRDGGQLTIKADFTTADIETVAPANGGKVLVDGAVWDNVGATYDFGSRASAFDFEDATINGGSVVFRDSPFNVSGSLTFNDASFLRGNLELNSSNSRVYLNNSRIAGDITVNESAFVQTDATNTEEIKTVSLQHAEAGFYLGKWNEDVSWQSHQLIQGQGYAGVGYTGQSFLNYGTIRANVDGGDLYSWSAFSSGDTYTNHGLLEAENGGTLNLGVTNGLFINQSDGVIRAKKDSTVSLFATNFRNHGVIDIQENGTLRLDGNYSSSHLRDLILDDSASVYLTGTLTLRESQTFKPTKHFGFASTSNIVDGAISFANVDDQTAINGSVTNSAITGNLNVSESANLSLLGTTSVSKNVSVDGGSLQVQDNALIQGDLTIRNSGTVTSGLENTSGNNHFRGNILIDGPNSYLEANGILGTAGSIINLANGGQIKRLPTQVLTFNEGVTVRGNGRIVVEGGYTGSYIGGVTNRGTIEAVGSDGLIEIFERGASTSFSNQGVLAARDSGRLVVIGNALIQHYGSSDAQIILDGGSLSTYSFISLNDGELSGTGSLSAQTFGVAVRGGRFVVGHDGVGTLDVFGNLSVRQASSSDVLAEIFFDIAGTEQGVADGYDFLRVDGHLTLGSVSPVMEGGYLNINAFDNVELADLLGAELSIIELTDTHSITGTFANVANGGLLTTEDERFQFNVFYGADSSYGANRVVLTNFAAFSGSASLNAIPEPNAALLMSFVLSVGLLRRRRNWGD